jgi:hypothetical protein
MRKFQICRVNFLSRARSPTRTPPGCGNPKGGFLGRGFGNPPQGLRSEKHLRRARCSSRDVRRSLGITLCAGVGCPRSLVRLPQGDGRAGLAFTRGAVGSKCNLIVLDASNVLHDAFTRCRPRCPRGRRNASWFSWTSPTRLVLAHCYLYRMLLRRVTFPGFCEPCLPSPAPKPPAGAGWLPPEDQRFA